MGKKKRFKKVVQRKYRDIEDFSVTILTMFFTIIGSHLLFFATEIASGCWNCENLGAVAIVIMGIVCIFFIPLVVLVEMENNKKVYYEEID